MVLVGTGHRPNGLTRNTRQMYTNGLVNALAEFFGPYLREIKPDKVIAGGALGADTGLAVAALRYGVHLTVAIPCYNQEAKWRDASKALYYKILDKADAVIYVEQGPYAAWKMQKRNEWMVDECDLVLALWSGNAGGTANCVEYATRKGKIVRNVWEDWVAFRTQYSL